MTKVNFSHIRVLALDVDGVLTDGRIIIGNEGELCKNFHCQDGLGIAVAQRYGLAVAIITGRTSAILEHRAKELGVTLLFTGVQDKAVALQKLAQQTGTKYEEIAYMGDDLNDLPALHLAGIALAPANAVPDVLKRVDYVTQKSGGHGAVREAIEKIMQAKGLWEMLVNDYSKNGQGDKQ